MNTQFSITPSLRRSKKTSLLRSSLAYLFIYLGLSFTAHAQTDEPTKGRWIVGVKAAQVELRGLETDTVRLEEADAFGVVVGYEFNQRIGGTNGTASFEVEYLTTSGDTNIEGLDPSFGELDADILNAFFAYRSSGQVFFKAKGGVSFIETTTNFDLFEPGTPGGVRFDDFSLAGGFGVGVRIGKERVKGLSLIHI